ncbi:MAG: hypothetical protein PVF29_07170 [Desulfobacterales bacterium]|jgi:hypothetical protein
MPLAFESLSHGTIAFGFFNMGAIHGICHTGFIGEPYRRYPFPQKPEAFKQKTNGFRNQGNMLP